MKLWEKIKEANKLECGENCESCQYKMVCLRGRKNTNQKIDRNLLLGVGIYLSIYFVIGLVLITLTTTNIGHIIVLGVWNGFLCLLIAEFAYSHALIPKIVKKYSISGTYCDLDGCIPLDGNNVTIRVGEIEVRK